MRATPRPPDGTIPAERPTTDRIGLGLAPTARLATISWVVAGIVVFVSALLRQTGVPKIDTLWAEDGTVFLQCAYDRGPAACLTAAYQGYLHLVPRLVATVASALPPGLVAPTMAVVAALVAATGAAIAARAIADATSSPLAGLLGGAGLGLVWQAGREVLGNAANVHLVLLAATVVAIVCSWFRGPVRLSTIGLAVVTGLTSPFALLPAVLSLASVALRRGGAVALLVVTSATAIVQVATELTSERVIPPGPGVSNGRLVDFFRDEVFRHGFFGDASFPPDLVVPLGLAAAVVAVVAVLLRRDRRLAVAIVVGVGVLVGIGMALGVISLVLNRSINPRYAYLPTTLIVAALAVAGGFLASSLGAGPPRVRRLAAAVMPTLLILVGLGFALSFRLEARASGGPDVPAEIAAAAATCTGDTRVSIPISPRPASDDWVVSIPCPRLAGAR